MGIEEAIGVTYEALIVIIKITFPALAITTALAAILTIFQSVTNINEASIQQDLKLFTTLAILFVTGPAIFIALRDYTLLIFERIAMLQ
ncbi:flagellar biosynthetic protein FliQ [Azospirillum agricola]|uniref:flagellar biosynthetic protein FliQ n=1 Tax=Azospirillum agricola TaxID=1720247 RepID=UPI000A0F1095|nr:flagellar biosynthetic protein FliQ [Azospirillum agricola]MBP2232326.1 flagellar biosynthetic protein FliQ [Azospirillum agricola]SMH56439.1 flagellar biosynthetic protein FliQ [Azospirillum lipoferum]